jgi:hypothetical protein
VSVLRIGLNEEVEILRRTRLRMKGNRISADDKIPNVVGVEGRQEFFEVVEHPERDPSSCTRRA